MKTTITSLFTLTLVFIAFQSLTYSSGPPAALTNAPGEGTCSGCHGSTVTSGTVWNNMTLTPVGATLATLVQGTTYTFNLTFSNAASNEYGFELCVLPGGATSSTASLGTLISTSTGTQLATSGTRTYLMHTSSGISAPSNTLTWSFDWTVPSTYTGGATFYVVVNSTDNNGIDNSGDIIYAKTFAATVSMPVSWLYTKAEVLDQNIAVNWATASEENNWKFMVERSTDKQNWEVVGDVLGKGNSSMVNKYSVLLDKAVGTTYYRIKQIDFNGKYSYSSMVVAKVNQNSKGPKLSYIPEQNGYSVSGESVKNITVVDINGTVRLSLTNQQFIPQLPAGIYLVQIDSEHGISQQKMVMY